jgi:hypothetical protein
MKKNPDLEFTTNPFHVLVLVLDGSRMLFKPFLFFLSFSPYDLTSSNNTVLFFFDCRFLVGFLCPLTWYYATILYFGNHYRRDPRERGGLAASAIAVSFLISFLILHISNRYILIMEFTTHILGHIVIKQHCTIFKDNT